MRRYSSRPSSYSKRSSFSRAEKKDSRTNMVTYKYIAGLTLTQAAGVMSYTFNPVYDFVNNDSRYASFVTTCNEWRVAKAAMKLMPSSIPQADMTHGINMLAVTCSDRQSDYKSGSAAVIPYLKIMSVPDSKCKMMQMGLDNTLYWSLTRAANQSTYIMAGSPPPTSPNGTNIFTPEFKVTFVNADTTSVGVCEFFFEVDMVIETRGSRFMNTV